MTDDSELTFTQYGWSVCLWIITASFQYGYHIAALNQIQAVLTCKAVDGNNALYSGLSTCIPMSDATFSFVTSVFTIGGLVGSAVANLVMEKWGRRGAIRISALFSVLGAGLMAISDTLTAFAFGRLFVGIGAGFGLCAGPVYIAEISPSRIKDRVGILTQLSVVFGILVTQAIGINCATPTRWRFVLLASSGIGIGQLFISPFIVESPVWLHRHQLSEALNSTARKLWGKIPNIKSEVSATDAEEPLLDDAAGHSEAHAVTVTVPQLLRAVELRRPLLIISLAMFTQQISGINAVMYYSNEILSNALPAWGPYVSLAITIVNVLMTFPAIFLVSRMGRSMLLQASVVGAVFSLLAVGFGLDNRHLTMVGVSILSFVMSFAVGLGPVPFVLIPEVSPAHAVSALSSVGLSVNWFTNFFIGLTFLPLRNALSSGDPLKEGRVFYLFAVLLSGSTYVLSKLYRG